MSEYQIAFLAYTGASVFGILILFLTLRGLYYGLRVIICLIFLSLSMTYFHFSADLQIPNIVSAAMEFINKDISKSLEYIKEIRFLFVRLLFFYFIYLFFNALFYEINRICSCLFDSFSVKTKNDSILDSYSILKDNSDSSYIYDKSLNRQFKESVSQIAEQDNLTVKDLDFLSVKEKQMLDVIFDSVLDKELIKERKK